MMSFASLMVPKFDLQPIFLDALIGHPPKREDLRCHLEVKEDPPFDGSPIHLEGGTVERKKSCAGQ